MIHTRRFVRAAVVVIGLAIAAAVGLVQPATAAAVELRDPSPYCRPVVDLPSALAPYYIGGNEYGFQVRGTVHLNCNGPVYYANIVAIFHARTSPYLTTDGISQGVGVVCSGSCTASMLHTRSSLSCDIVYDYYDHVQIVGSWKRYSTSASVSVSLEGVEVHGSSYNPSVCPRD